jgi:hypothetical protein
MNLESHESAEDRQFADYHTDRNGHSITPEPKKRISYKSELKEITKSRDMWRKVTFISLGMWAAMVFGMIIKLIVTE